MAGNQAIFVTNDCAVWYVSEAAPYRFGGFGGTAFGMEGGVHLGYLHPTFAAYAGFPRFGESFCPRVLTLETWAMTCGERGHFVEKEELGILAFAHQGAGTTLEFERTDDPIFRLPACASFQCARFGIVEAASSIAHKQAALWSGDDGSLWCDTILKRHDVTAIQSLSFSWCQCLRMAVYRNDLP